MIMGKLISRLIIGFPHPIYCQYVNGRRCGIWTHADFSLGPKPSPIPDYGLTSVLKFLLVREDGSRTVTSSTRNLCATFIPFPVEIGVSGGTRTLNVRNHNPLEATIVLQTPLGKRFSQCYFFIGNNPTIFFQFSAAPQIRIRSLT